MADYEIKQSMDKSATLSGLSETLAKAVSDRIKTDYEFKQHSVAIPTVNDIISFTIRNRSQAAFDQIAKELNTSLYGDEIPYSSPSMWNRIKRKARVYRTRVSDAWGVLNGRLEVGSDW